MKKRFSRFISIIPVSVGILFLLLFSGCGQPRGKRVDTNVIDGVLSYGQEIGANVMTYRLPEGMKEVSSYEYADPSGEIRIFLDSPSDKLRVDSSGFQLYPDTHDAEAMSLNRRNLQAAIDACSALGGGTVMVAQGRYFFDADTDQYVTKPNESVPIYHVLIPGDNVTVAGSLEDGRIATWFLPYGDYDGPVNMFDMGDFSLYEKGRHYRTLVNADFRDFGIDSEYTHSLAKYNANGKGFMLAPIRDCDWYNVIVMNTDGTGFGMDEPVNCTITNCTAVSCGKQARPTDIGASGFGIGYGLSKKESFIIRNCLSLYNRKFGFFYESQNRFRPKIFKYDAVNGPLTIEHCISYGNMYNYGGECAHFTELKECSVSAAEVDIAQYRNVNGVETRADYYFGSSSSDNYITLNGIRMEYEQLPCGIAGHFDGIYKVVTPPTFSEDGKKEKVCTKCGTVTHTCLMPKLQEMHFKDVPEDSDYYEDICAVCSRNIMTDFGQEEFCPRLELDRGSFIEILWRLDGCPRTGISESFVDVPSSAGFAEAVSWACENGLVSGYSDGTFRPSNALTKEQLCIILIKYAAFKGYEIRYAADISSAKDVRSIMSGAKDSLQWAVAADLIGMNRNRLEPKSVITREEAASILSHFVNAFCDGSGY